MNLRTKSGLSVLSMTSVRPNCRDVWKWGPSQVAGANAQAQRPLHPVWLGQLWKPSSNTHVCFILPPEQVALVPLFPTPLPL